MEKKEEIWSEISFVKSSNYRPDILGFVSKGPVTLSQICQYATYDIFYMSKIIKELTERGLVKCLDDSKNKDRFYIITKKGSIVLKEIKKINIHQLGDGVINFNETKLEEAINNTFRIKELTHNLFPYPARFPPSIPRFFIEELTNKGEVVLDPFSGGGTTILESSVLGRTGIGIDLNKLGTFISKVKTTPIKSEILREYLKNIENNFSKIIIGLNKNLFSEKDIGVISLENRKKISTLKHIIDNFPQDIRDFFLCCLINSCNIFSNRKITNTDIYFLFIKKSKKFITSMEEFSSNFQTKTQIYHDDTRNILKHIKENSVDLIVTSPAYPDVHIEYNNLMLESRRGSKLLYNLIDYKEEKSGAEYRLGTEKSYFENFDSILEEIVKTLKEGKKFVMIIGLKNNEHLIQLKKIFSNNNLILLNEYLRKVPNRQWYNQLNKSKNKGIPFEYVLIYEKTNKR